MPQRLPMTVSMFARAPSRPRRSRLWMATTVGVLLGLSLIGCLQKGVDGEAFVVSSMGVVYAIGWPPAYTLMRGLRRWAYWGGVNTAFAVAFAASIGAAATGDVRVEGLFVLVLFVLCDLLSIGAVIRSRGRRQLATWVAGCATVAFLTGAAAVLGGDTHGPHQVVRGPLETVAGLALFGLLLTPVLATARLPRRRRARA
jgi:hypothetical protein